MTINQKQYYKILYKDNLNNLRKADLKKQVLKKYKELKKSNLEATDKFDAEYKINAMHLGVIEKYYEFHEIKSSFFSWSKLEIKEKPDVTLEEMGKTTINELQTLIQNETPGNWDKERGGSGQIEGKETLIVNGINEELVKRKSKMREELHEIVKAFVEKPGARGEKKPTDHWEQTLKALVPYTDIRDVKDYIATLNGASGNTWKIAEVGKSYLSLEASAQAEKKETSITGQIIDTLKALEEKDKSLRYCNKKFIDVAVEQCFEKISRATTNGSSITMADIITTELQRYSREIPFIDAVFRELLHEPGSESKEKVRTSLLSEFEQNEKKLSDNSLSDKEKLIAKAKNEAFIKVFGKGDKDKWNLRYAPSLGKEYARCLMSGIKKEQDIKVREELLSELDSIIGVFVSTPVSKKSKKPRIYWFDTLFELMPQDEEAKDAKRSQRNYSVYSLWAGAIVSELNKGAGSENKNKNDTAGKRINLWGFTPFTPEGAECLKQRVRKDVLKQYSRVNDSPQVKEDEEVKENENNNRSQSVQLFLKKILSDQSRDTAYSLEVVNKEIERLDKSGGSGHEQDHASQLSIVDNVVLEVLKENNNEERAFLVAGDMVLVIKRKVKESTDYKEKKELLTTLGSIVDALADALVRAARDSSFSKDSARCSAGFNAMRGIWKVLLPNVTDDNIDNIYKRYFIGGDDEWFRGEGKKMLKFDLYMHATGHFYQELCASEAIEDMRKEIIKPNTQEKDWPEIFASNDTIDRLKNLYADSDKLPQESGASRNDFLSTLLQEGSVTEGLLEPFPNTEADDIAAKILQVKQEAIESKKKSLDPALVCENLIKGLFKLAKNEKDSKGRMEVMKVLSEFTESLALQSQQVNPTDAWYRTLMALHPNIRSRRERTLNKIKQNKAHAREILRKCNMSTGDENKWCFTVEGKIRAAWNTCRQVATVDRQRELPTVEKIGVPGVRVIEIPGYV